MFVSYKYFNALQIAAEQSTFSLKNLGNFEF